jgi:hypothetical protein
MCTWISYAACPVALLFAVLSFVIDRDFAAFVFNLAIAVGAPGLGLYIELFCSNDAPRARADFKRWWADLKYWRPVVSLESPICLVVGVALLVASPFGFASNLVAGAVPLVLALSVIGHAVTARLEKIARPPLPLTHIGHQAAVQETPPGAVFVGLQADKPGKPSVHLDQRLKPAHGLICGRTMTGKSSGYECPWSEQQLSHGDTTVVHFMFRRDLATYHRMVEFCERHRIPHALVTLVENVGSRLRNHYLDPAFRAMGPQQRAELMSEAQGTSKSEAHGHGHWTDQNERIHRSSHMGWPDLCSYSDHRDRLADPAARKAAGITSRQVELGGHAVSIMEKMACARIFNQVPGRGVGDSFFRHEVTSYKIVRRPCYVAFIYPSLDFPTTGRIAARTDLRQIIAALSQLDTTERVPYVSMYFDDCAPMIEQSLTECLTNARDLGAGLYFGIQSLSDFKNPDCDLRPTIVTNATTQVFLTAIDEETRRHIIDASGQKIVTLDAEGRTVTESPMGKSRGDTRQRRELLAPTIGPNELMRVNNSEHLAILIAPNIGVTQLDGPTIIETPRSLSPEDFKRLNRTPLPSPDGIATIAAKDLPAWQPKRNKDDQDGDEQGQGASPEKPKTPPATIIARKSARSKRNDPELQAESEEAAEAQRRRKKDRINRMFGGPSADA